LRKISLRCCRRWSDRSELVATESQRHRGKDKNRFIINAFSLFLCPSVSLWLDLVPDEQALKLTVPSNWYEEFFHGVALDLWRKAVSPEQTKAEADFLVKTLQCHPGSRLLDVPCGNGRLSLELARRGYRMTGLDISPEFIDEARASILNLGLPDPPATAGGNDTARTHSATATPKVEFLLGDMKRIEAEATFDGAFCFGNSFGYLLYSDMEAFLNGVARGLKPGARFVVETGMAAESILPKLEERMWYQIQDILMTIEHRYLAEESCVDSEYTFVRDGKTETRYTKHWVYTVAEIRRMLERAGFAVSEMFGSVNCQPYALGSNDLLMVAQRV
jgi:SAM-dependent methyltransferase